MTLWKRSATVAALLAVGTASQCVLAAEAAVAKDVAVPVPVKVLRYAQHVVGQHDQNGDGQLDEGEAQPLGALAQEADVNGDKVVTVDELTQHVARYGARRRIRLMPFSPAGEIRLPSLLHQGSDSAAKPDTPPADEQVVRNAAGGQKPEKTSSTAAKGPAYRKYFVRRSRLPEGLPNWFLERDADGDGQLTLAEYAPNASAASSREFSALDLNRDGLLTPAELMASQRRSRHPAPERAKAGGTAAPSKAPKPTP